MLPRAINQGSMREAALSEGKNPRHSAHPVFANEPARPESCALALRDALPISLASSHAGTRLPIAYKTPDSGRSPSACDARSRSLSLAPRLSGLFARIRRCFPLRSTKDRCGKPPCLRAKILAIRRTPLTHTNRPGTRAEMPETEEAVEAHWPPLTPEHGFPWHTTPHTQGAPPQAVTREAVF